MWPAPSIELQFCKDGGRGDRLNLRLPGCTPRERRAAAFTHARWTREELQLLRAHYPDHGELSRLLPRRTRGACKQMASKINLDAGRFRWKGIHLLALRRLYPKSDWDTLRNAFPGASTRAIMRAAATHGVRREPKPLKEGHHFTIHQIKLEARRMGLSIKHLDELTGGGEYFTKSCSRKRINIQKLDAALVLLDGSLKLVWQTGEPHDQAR